MNFDPSQTPGNHIPDRGDEIIADKESASAASGTTTAIVGFLVAVVIVALVVAWSPWSGGSSSPSDITPGQGGADTTPAPGIQIPSRPSSPDQPQVVPTTIAIP
jgi:hypothetical protein